ncbi:hypothetical protein L484_008486 [Morus notabilis]|uniref:Uncharacterized protein n=1 Tax=Morus notabilis TaxID=981085 RepID=W9S706_9ROSA|nr:hypothetical protein L484_008486 [Morus notabilis]
MGYGSVINLVTLDRCVWCLEYSILQLYVLAYFGQSTSSFGSSPFGTSTSPFGAQSSGFEDSREDGLVQEKVNLVKVNQKSNEVHDDHTIQKGDSYMTLSGHRAGEAAIVYEHGADIEALMPKLWRSDRTLSGPPLKFTYVRRGKKGKKGSDVDNPGTDVELAKLLGELVGKGI